MTCKNCNTNVTETMKFCPKCGAKLEIIETKEVKQEFSSFINKVKNFILVNKKLVIIFLIVLIVLISIILFFIFRKPKLKTLENFEAKNSIKFEIDGKKYYLGEKVSDFKEFELDQKYLDKDSYVISQSITLQTLYKDDEPQFLALLHCSDDKNCEYKDSNIIKINFYENSNVLVDGHIKYGMSYEDVVDEYGKEDGVFYQDENYLVWNFGEEGQIGEAYMLLRFDDGWFATGINDIRIGVWWYEGEYEHTVEED